MILKIPHRDQLERVSFALTPLLILAAVAVLPVTRLPSMCLFQRVWEIPCPGCGITRSLCALARGDLLLALNFNPAGFVVFPAFVLQAVIGGTTEIGLAQRVTRIRVCLFPVGLLALLSGRKPGLIGARPVEQKKGADRGIDGRLYFHDEGRKGKETKQAIFSVKAGHVTSSHVRDLVGVLTREKAELGVLISFEEPTRDMRKEAASAGFYESSWGKHPRVQLLTVGALLEGNTVDMPRTAGTNRTFKKAPKAKRVKEVHPELFNDE